MMMGDNMKLMARLTRVEIILAAIFIMICLLLLTSFINKGSLLYVILYIVGSSREKIKVLPPLRISIPQRSGLAEVFD